MSHFSRLATKFVDPPALLAALADLGYPAGVVEVHQQPQRLANVYDRRNPQSAHIILRQRVTDGYADTGFLRQADGCYAAIVDLSHPSTNQAWLNRLTQRYAYHVAVTQAAAQGFSLIQTEDENGELRLTFMR